MLTCAIDCPLSGGGARRHNVPGGCRGERPRSDLCRQGGSAGPRAWIYCELTIGEAVSYLILTGPVPRDQSRRAIRAQDRLGSFRLRQLDLAGVLGEERGAHSALRLVALSQLPLQSVAIGARRPSLLQVVVPLDAIDEVFGGGVAPGRRCVERGSFGPERWFHT